MAMASKHVEELQKDESHDPGCITKCVESAWSDSHGSYRKNGYTRTAHAALLHSDVAVWG